MKIELNGTVCSDNNAKVYRYFGYTVCCPMDVRKAIDGCKDGEELELEINSGGGSVYAGFEMYSLLRDHKGKTVAKVQSMAGSAMSVIIAACDQVLISPVANVMIHRASTYAEGNQEDMEQTRQMLDTIDQSILEAYVAKVGDKCSREDILEMMENETFLTAKRAVELGFADAIWKPEGKAEGAVAAVSGMGDLPPVEDLLRRGKERGTNQGHSENEPEEPGHGEDGNGPVGENERLVTDQGNTLCDQNTKHKTRSEEAVEIENVEQLAQAYPELVAQVRSTAAQAERARITGIDAVAVAGFEDIINKAKEDPNQNAGTVAVDIIKAQKKAGETYLEQREKETEPTNAVPAAGTPEGESDEGKEKAELVEQVKAAVKAFYGEKKEEK